MGGERVARGYALFSCLCVCVCLCRYASSCRQAECKQQRTVGLWWNLFAVSVCVCVLKTYVSDLLWVVVTMSYGCACGAWCCILYAHVIGSF